MSYFIVKFEADVPEPGYQPDIHDVAQALVHELGDDDISVVVYNVTAERLHRSGLPETLGYRLS